MRKLAKLLMIFLSYAPIASVAVAAQAKASEMDGEDQLLVLRKQAIAARNRLMPEGHSSISFQDLIKRYKNMTGLEGLELQQSMQKDIQILIERGALEVNEDSVISGSPSHFAL